MKGIEGMFASMLGLTPEGIKQMSEKVQGAILQLATDVAEIKVNQQVILEALERIENVGRTTASDGDSGNASGNADGNTAD